MLVPPHGSTRTAGHPSLPHTAVGKEVCVELSAGGIAPPGALGSLYSPGELPT